MREIPLTRGKVALVDNRDYDWLMQWKWYAHPVAGARRYSPNGPHACMHREIMNVMPGMEVDHANHDPFDNRRGNLRVCTRTQNLQNRRAFKNNPNGYKGIWFNPKNALYLALISVNGKRIRIGWFKTPEGAAAAYNKAAKMHFGEFAVLNTLPSPEYNEPVLILPIGRKPKTR